jgi:hypothetical protein
LTDDSIVLVKATTALPSQDYNDKAIDKTLKYPTKAAAKAPQANTTFAKYRARTPTIKY